MYLTYEEYEAMGGLELEADILPQLQTASDYIDRLTYNRIFDFDKLTEFQQDKVKRACMVQAEFLYQNQDAVSSALDSYL